MAGPANGDFLQQLLGARELRRSTAPTEASHFDMVHQYQRDPKPRRPDRHVQTVVVAAPIDRRGTPLATAYGTARPRLRRSDAPPRSSHGD